MNFCSHCGSAGLLRQVPAGDNRMRIVCGDCGKVQYENPRIVTGCLPLWNGKVLLCRRAIEPRRGFWNVPGGFLENGERVEDGATREVWEEAEARIKIIGVHTIFTLTDFHHVFIHFLGDLLDGRFGVGAESSESRLFTEQEIPWGAMAFHSSIFTLEKYFEDRRKGVRRVHLGGQ